jgi:ATP adenylyltransferase
MKDKIKRLWAPWRTTYVRSIHKKTKGCLFCRMIREKKDKKNYIFVRTPYAYGVLNIYPYNNGHILVVPVRHVPDLSKLKKYERDDLIDLQEKCRKALIKALRPAGFNIGMNLGRAAGAGIPGHLHIHMVPRWVGDTNFMPSAANTKVVSQALEEVYQRLKTVLC